MNPLLLASCTLLLPGPLQEGSSGFEPADVFELELAADPRISPDGRHVVYVRRFFDVMTDRARSNLWIVATDGSEHRPLTTGNENDSQPRWSPDGERLAYASSSDGTSQLYVRWMDTGQTAKITNLTESPGSLAWSPDGRWIAFTSFVEEVPEPLAELPARPEGAEWAPAAKVITELRYRSDGQGFLSQGNRQLFVVPADGGTPRQLTWGPFDVDGTPEWDADGTHILVSSNRREDADLEPVDSEIHEVSPIDGRIRPLTSRYGRDRGPRISPDGSRIAYLGFDDRHQGYQVTRLYVMSRDGSQPRALTERLDRSIGAMEWAPDGEGLFVSYADQGDTWLAYVPLDPPEGQEAPVRPLIGGVGGTTLGRPYASGSFSVSGTGLVAFTGTAPSRPADVSLLEPGARSLRRLTHLNEDLFGHKELGDVEEIRFASSHDELPLQGWIVKPPGFDPESSYPLLLEIHGGPFANYGPRFSAECQLYAAAGYVVLYMNPRGSTSYGEEFGNAIHHAYPGHDYDDLMSGVDAVLARGYVDPERLFVTGGSGGGVLTAWTVGKTDRFRAAVVAKPVIHWTSFALTADNYNYYYKYWFPAPPWEAPEHYWARSPLSLVGEVSTPTMLLTGEADYRTPMSESEQYYQALKLRGVDTALVRIPEASHGITARPSHLIAKVAHVLAWFARHDG